MTTEQFETMKAKVGEADRLQSLISLAEQFLKNAESGDWEPCLREPRIGAQKLCLPVCIGPLRVKVITEAERQLADLKAKFAEL